PQAKRAAVNGLRNGGVDLLSDRSDLRGEVDVGNFLVHSRSVEPSSARAAPAILNSRAAAAADPCWIFPSAGGSLLAMPLLEISQLKKSFVAPDGATHVVVDIPAFALDAHAQVVLAGESGSGKTT